jgi:hypothetical protein
MEGNVTLAPCDVMIWSESRGLLSTDGYFKQCFNAVGEKVHCGFEGM